MFEDFLPTIRCLPEERPLTQADLLGPELRIYRHGTVESYYMPFGGPVSGARLLLAGITPGWQQMELAYREIRRGLGDGLDVIAARINARYVASFAGPMRTNLAAMLDGIGVARALRIGSSADLFAGERTQLHTTSVLPHPVFVNGKNYSGYGGGVAASPFANFCTRDLFVGELQSVPGALIVPMGDFVSSSLRELIFADWPEVDAIVGNPPYLGTQKIRRELGSNYLQQLQQTTGVDGVVDMVCYWFRRAHDQLPVGGRAGLVGTSAIRVGKAREVALDYVVARGGTITNAVSSRVWQGYEAALNVSMVNWVKGTVDGPHHLIVDDQIYLLARIPTHLQLHADVFNASNLKANDKGTTMGVIFGHEAFRSAAADFRAAEGGELMAAKKRGQSTRTVARRPIVQAPLAQLRAENAERPAPGRVPLDRQVAGAPSGYVEWITDLKVRIRAAQQRAALAVNTEMLQLYWQIGRDILDRQAEAGWGTKILSRIEADLRAEFPEMRGFSQTNLKYMRMFAGAWPDPSIVQRVVGQLPWGINITLLTKLKTPEERLLYAVRAVDHGWSRPLFTHHVTQPKVVS